MNELFLKIINHRYNLPSWLILVLLILRLILKESSQIRSNVLLWGIVAVRLICLTLFWYGKCYPKFRNNSVGLV